MTIKSLNLRDETYTMSVHTFDECTDFRTYLRSGRKIL